MSAGADDTTDAVKLLDPYSPVGCDHLRSRPCIECRRERCEDWYDVYADKLKSIDELEAQLAAVTRERDEVRSLMSSAFEKYGIEKCGGCLNDTEFERQSTFEMMFYAVSRRDFETAYELTKKG